MLQRPHDPRPAPLWVALASPHPSSHWRRGQLLRVRVGVLAGKVVLLDQLLSPGRARVVTDLFGGFPAIVALKDLEAPGPIEEETHELRQRLRS